MEYSAIQLKLYRFLNSICDLSRNSANWCRNSIQKWHERGEFNSHQEIRGELRQKSGIVDSDKRMYAWVKYCLKTSAQSPEFGENGAIPWASRNRWINFGENLASLAWQAAKVMGVTGKVRSFCQDETRLKSKTLTCRKVARRGIKPKGEVGGGSFQRPISMALSMRIAF